MDEAGAELHLDDSVSLRVRRVISDVPDVHLLRLLCVRVVVTCAAWATNNEDGQNVLGER